jgi:hypothetical protein
VIGILSKLIRLYSERFPQLGFLALLLALLFLDPGCDRKPQGDAMLFDFESDAELDRLYWKCHVLYSLSDEHATSGSKSLRMELYPSEYPGLSPALTLNDWSGYRAFVFDVYNPMPKEVRLTLRIDDRKDAYDYGERYNETIVLRPGSTQVVKDLSTLKTSGTKRQLEINKIHRFLMFVVKPEEKVVLYVDNIRLVS